MYDLGLSESQFWRLTPAKLAYLIDRLESDNKYMDTRFGAIVSTIINMVSGKQGGKQVTPLSVMGYEEDNHQDDPNAVVTQQTKQASQQATALRFRLLQAAGKWGGGK